MNGAYAGFVWAAYGISLTGLGLAVAAVATAWSRAKRRLRAVEDSETKF